MLDSDRVEWTRKLLMAGERCIDVGCGTSPQNIIRYDQHICVEPNPVSVCWLERRAFNVRAMRAQEVLPDLAPSTAVFLIDVLHCLTLDDAAVVLALAKRKAVLHLIVAEPFAPATNGSDLWNRARSIWRSDMLGNEPGWQHKETHAGFVSVLSRLPP